MAPRVGVLALQGDFREHLEAFTRIGADAIEVRTTTELDSVDAIVIPGGESTTIAKLARNFGLFEPLQAKISAGLPAFGTCAGLILLANRLIDGIEGQETLGGLNVTVQRNAFGNQLDSFEVDLAFEGINGSVHAAFIRAPLIVETGDAEVLSKLADGRVVAVKQGNILGIAFHPEVTGEDRVHELFWNEFVK